MVGSQTKSVVIFGFLSAVGVIPGVEGGLLVPKSVSFLAGGILINDVASSEVGLEGRLSEGNEDKVLASVPSLQVEAFHIAVIPGVVEGGSLFAESFSSCVPIVMGTKEAS